MASNVFPGMSPEIIEGLILDALKMVPHEDIYNKALQNVNTEELYQSQTIDAESIAQAFSVAGFIEGIRFTLEHLNAQEAQGQ